MNQLSGLTSAQLKQAFLIKEQIEGLERELASILGNGPITTRRSLAKKRTMSAPARARISAAQKARWAARRTGRPVHANVNPGRKMSAAARKRLSQVAKARWVKVRAVGRTSL